jgi:hypothetical protein
VSTGLESELIAEPPVLRGVLRYVASAHTARAAVSFYRGLGTGIAVMLGTKGSGLWNRLPANLRSVSGICCFGQAALRHS